MKKFFAIILALACAFSLFSCGDDPCAKHVDEDADGKCDVCGETIPVCEHEDTDGDGKCDKCQEDMEASAAVVSAFKAAMNNTKPAVVKLDVKVTTKFGDLKASYVTTYNADGSSTVAYSVEKFNTLATGSADDFIDVETGTVTCQNGAYSDGGSISGNITAAAGSQLVLDSELMQLKYSTDANILTAIVSAANTQAVFGTAFGDVSLTVTKFDGKITSYSMEYDRVSGADTNHVVVSCEFQ